MWGISWFQRFFASINRQGVQVLLLMVIFASFLIFPLIVVVDIFFANDRSVNLNFIKDVYQSFGNMGIIYMWSTGLNLSLIAYFAFIHDKSKSNLDSEREKGKVEVEIQKREESLHELLTVRTDKKYDIVQQRIMECMVLKHKHFKSDEDYRNSHASASHRLIYSCIEWVQEIDWVWTSRVSDEGKNLYSDALNNSNVTLTKGRNRTINMEAIMDEIKKEVQSSTEELVKFVSNEVDALEEKLEALKKFNNNLIKTYVYTYSRV